MDINDQRDFAEEDANRAAMRAEAESEAAAEGEPAAPICLDKSCMKYGYQHFGGHHRNASIPMTIEAFGGFKHVLDEMIKRHVRNRGMVSMYRRATYNAIVHAASVMFEETPQEADKRCQSLVKAETTRQEIWGA